MQTDRLGAAVVVVLAVLAIAATAAAVDGTQSEPRLDTGGSGDPGAGGGSDGGAGQDSGPEQRSADTEYVPDPSDYLGVALKILFAGVAAVMVGMVALTYYRDGREGLLAIARDVRNFLVAGGVYLLAVALFAAIISWFRLNYEGGDPAQPEESSNPGGSSDGGAGDAAADVATELPITAVAMLALVALAVALLFVYRSRVLSALGQATGDVAPPQEGADEERNSGGNASETPAPLRDVDATNGVYDAWREMAQAVDRSGLRTSTPMEIASRAVDEGLDRDAVRTLTDVFEEVRYGDRPADDDRVSRAKSALDRLDPSTGEEA